MHPMLNIAVRAARKAGNLIAKNYETPDAVEASQKGSNDFVTNVDKAAEAVIIDTNRKSYLLHTRLSYDRVTLPRSGEQVHSAVVSPPRSACFTCLLPPLVLSSRGPTSGAAKLGVS